MKNLITALFLSFGLMTFTHASEEQVSLGMEDIEKGIPIYLQYCQNYGQGVNYGYQSCVNSNFSSISRVIGGFMPMCVNYGNEVDYFYTNCINTNFREVERQLRGSVYLQTCTNYNRATLDGFFVMCVNQNFQTISHVLGRM